MLYPIGIQDFEKIRKGRYVYVDKTHLVYKLVQKGGYYFLSRPRRFRKQLQGFYSVMKAKDACIKFGFLTGVTKVGKLSVFSGLNNLKDISMDARYTDICGISEKDLKKYFGESVEELAEANDLTANEAYNQLAEMYDGYHFCEDSEGMYNPFSLLNTFDSLKFKEYWFEMGTPSFIVQVMKDTDYDVTRLSDEEIDASSLMDVDTVYHNPRADILPSRITITSISSIRSVFRTKKSKTVS